MIVIGLEHLYICKQTARKNDRMGNGLFVARLFSPENGIDRSRGRNLGLEIGLNGSGLLFFFFFYPVSWVLRESNKSVSILV